MTKKIFIWVGHPNETSLCGALAEAYAEGARRSGAEVRLQKLSDMSFDMEETDYYKTGSDLDEDLQIWQQNVSWADHLLFIHPYWWGGIPGKAKAVLDRALAPGFGFKYHQRGIGWDKLLEGKSADAIITSDTPPLLDRFLYGRPGRRVMKNQILGFCGVKCRSVLQFGSVKLADPAKIKGWINKAGKLGAKRAA